MASANRERNKKLAVVDVSNLGCFVLIVTVPFQTWEDTVIGRGFTEAATIVSSLVIIATFV